MYEADEGSQDFRIELTLDSNPIPDDGNLLWFFNGQPLVNGVNGIMFGVDFIQFRSLSRVNAGSYRVMSSNAAGSGEFSFQLRVNCKGFPLCFTGCYNYICLYCCIVVEGTPFYNGNGMVRAVEGSENFTIQLTFEANPLPQEGNFSWFFNGRQLIDREDGIYLGLTTIVFRTVSRNNTGTYRIMSSNAKGSGEFIFQLLVNCMTYIIIIIIIMSIEPRYHLSLL